MKKLLTLSIVLLLSGCLIVPSADAQVLQPKKRTAICVNQNIDDVRNEIVHNVAKREGWYSKRFPNAKRGSVVIIWTDKGQKAYVVR